MSKNRKKQGGYFVCNHCGAEVPSGAKVCRECGSDAETGWSQDSEKWEADIPSGYSSGSDFDYDEYIASEFPKHAQPSLKRSTKKWAWRIFVLILLVALILYLILRV